MQSCLQGVLKCAPLTIALLVCLGCGGDDGRVKRVGVTGTVTFEGEPVPFGSIKFEPDRKRGGKGPSGFAQIKDGQFDTGESGRGSVVGPMIVTIQGVATDELYAPPLFKPYQTSTDVAEDSEPLVLEVPETQKFKRRKAK